MGVEHVAYRANTRRSRMLESQEHGSRGSYEGELRRTQDRLQEALARQELLLQQNDDLLQQHEIMSKLLASRKGAIRCVAALTARERQVMELVLAGEPNKNIAADLGISQRTVENHRAAVMKKTGSKSLPALARFALAAAWNGADEPFVQPLARLALAAVWKGSSGPQPISGRISTNKQSEGRILP